MSEPAKPQVVRATRPCIATALLRPLDRHAREAATELARLRLAAPEVYAEVAR